MTERKKPTIKFINLHAHSNASLFDGFEYPAEHMEFAYENGMDALALTDHGTMANLSYQILHAKQMQKDGVNFKPIFGIEVYAHPSFEEWETLYSSQDEKTKKSDDGSATVIEDEDSKAAFKSALKHRRHMVLLAKNQQGLTNLFKMVSLSYEKPNFYYYPRVDYKMLAEHSEGIVATSACMGGIYAGDYWQNRDEGEEAVLVAMRKTSKKMLSIYGDDWYGELQWNSIPEQHEINDYVIRMSKEFGFELISAADAHFPYPEAWKSRELYKRLSPKLKNFDQGLIPDTIEEMGYELYPKNGDEMWESYLRHSEKVGVSYDDNLVKKSIEKTHEIAFEKIESFFPSAEVQLPSFVVPEGASAGATLKNLVSDAMKERGLEDKKDYRNRIERELFVIEDRGFSKYFLTMTAIDKIARATMLVGPGRGSACGSLVAYVLGITDIDPIKHGTLFERFLRSDATDYPDIDYDVSDSFGLKEVLMEKWGKNTVVPISNWNTLQLKSLIKDISKFYEIPFKEVNEVTSKMIHEATPKAKKDHGIKSGVYDPTYEEVLKYSDTLKKFLKRYPEVGQDVDNLRGQTRSCSRHAGGVVIADNLNEKMPLITSKGVKQTPWTEGQNVRHLEPLGFIKFDLLGLGTLRMIEYAISSILKREHGLAEPTHKDIRKFYDENLHPDVIDTDNQDVYRGVYHKGKWAGIFQFTEVGAQSLCKSAMPSNIVDIATITAIYRPGPLGADVDKKYLAAKRDPGSVKYLNSIHEEEASSTYGFLIFQEQIAMLAHRLGDNITLDEGNLLRKVLTKKGTGKTLQVKTRLHDKFIRGCKQRDMTTLEAEEMWQNFEYFMGYGFNFSHALAYSFISFQCAWLLHYYPECWLAAYLNVESEKTSSGEKEKIKKEKAISLVKSLGYNIELPNINKSSDRWEISADGSTLFQPLTDVKGCGQSAYDKMKDHRPFNTIEDLMFNPDMKPPNKSVLDKLIRAQAMNELMDNRFTGLKHFWSAVAVSKPKKLKNLLDNIDNPVYRAEGDFTTEEIITYLTDLTNLFPMDMVMTRRILQQLEDRGVPPIGEFDKDLLYCWFIPREVITKKTKTGKTFWVMKVVDSTFKMTQIKVWGVNPKKDSIQLNRPYIAKKMEYDPQWGFSTPWDTPPSKNFILLG